jgi:hypothetical protein
MRACINSRGLGWGVLKALVTEGILRKINPFQRHANLRTINKYSIS